MGRKPDNWEVSDRKRGWFVGHVYARNGHKACRVARRLFGAWPRQPLVARPLPPRGAK